MATNATGCRLGPGSVGKQYLLLLALPRLEAAIEAVAEQQDSAHPNDEQYPKQDVARVGSWSSGQNGSKYRCHGLSW